MVADFRAANPAVCNVEFLERMDSPLAASSPIPPKSSRIPVKNAVNPPPLAPKPKLSANNNLNSNNGLLQGEKPERMDFDSKRRHFEDRIRGEAHPAAADKPTHPPPKRPLVHSQDLRPQPGRASAAAADLIPMIDEDSANASIDHDLQDLMNGK